MKHKFKNNPEFEALLKDTTSEVLRSHLLDDEEEDINANQNLTDENKNLLKEAKRMNLKLSKPINVERPRSSSSSAGANSQRHRRKSRGGVGLRKEKHLRESKKISQTETQVKRESSHSLAIRGYGYIEYD